MSDPVAVVVGLCAHGLAMVRALAKSGVEVIALEADSSLPGIGTRFAQIKIVDDINGLGLISALLRLAPDISADGPPILLVTNDKMVATVGSNYDQLSGTYQLSWAQSRQDLLRLLKKNYIERQARRNGILYPTTLAAINEEDLSEVVQCLRFPVIVKPDAPLSSYKTLVASTPEELASYWPRIASALPAIIQEFIEGGEERTVFGAMYLENGDVITRLEGRKLRSRPLGHTTIAISEKNDRVHRRAKDFFEGLSLSGPVSVEFKEDSNGELWVIEPTVGRTDFWVGLCIADGINLPLVEYGRGVGRRIECGLPENSTVWLNEERDPAGLFWLLASYPAILRSNRLVGVFPDMHDPVPFIKWCIRGVRHLPKKMLGRLRRVVRSRPGRAG